MAGATPGVMTLNTVSLTSNEQGFSNACFVHPSDFAALCASSGADASDKLTIEKGILCAVNEAIFFVRQFDRAMPGTIAVGMLQRMAGNMMMNAPVPVMPFKLSKGVKLPLSSITMEMDILGKAPDGEVSRIALLATLGALSSCASDS
jgi:hypothetical protein